MMYRFLYRSGSPCRGRQALSHYPTDRAGNFRVAHPSRGGGLMRGKRDLRSAPFAKSLRAGRMTRHARRRARHVSHLRRSGFFLPFFPPLPRWASLCRAYGAGLEWRTLLRRRRLSCGASLRACGCDDYAACDDECCGCGINSRASRIPAGRTSLRLGWGG